MSANTVVAQLPVVPATMSFSAIFSLISGMFNTAEWPNLTVSFLSYEL